MQRNRFHLHAARSSNNSRDGSVLRARPANMKAFDYIDEKTQNTPGLVVQFPPVCRFGAGAKRHQS